MLFLMCGRRSGRGRRCYVQVRVLTTGRVRMFLIVAAPCALLLMPTPWNWRTVLRWVGMGVVAGLVVSLPIILWDPKGFVRCTISPIMNAYFRYDALSFLALYAKQTGVTPSASI